MPINNCREAVYENLSPLSLKKSIYNNQESRNGSRNNDQQIFSQQTPDHVSSSFMNKDSHFPENCRYQLNSQMSPSSALERSQQAIQSHLDEISRQNTEIRHLQKHIFNLQSKQQQSQREYSDQVEKLKLHIECCENEIKKREQRENALTERIETLEVQINNLTQIQAKWQGERSQLLEQQQFFNRQRSQFIETNEELQRLNELLKAEVQRIYRQNQSLISQIKGIQKQWESQILELREQYEKKLQYSAQEVFEKKTNAETVPKTGRLTDCEQCRQTMKQSEQIVYEKQKIIEALQKDVECLMSFFEQ